MTRRIRGSDRNAELLTAEAQRTQRAEHQKTEDGVTEPQRPELQNPRAPEDGRLRTEDRIRKKVAKLNIEKGVHKKSITKTRNPKSTKCSD